MCQGRHVSSVKALVRSLATARTGITFSIHVSHSLMDPNGFERDNCVIYQSYFRFLFAREIGVGSKNYRIIYFTFFAFFISFLFFSFFLFSRFSLFSIRVFLVLFIFLFVFHLLFFFLFFLFFTPFSFDLSIPSFFVSFHPSSLYFFSLSSFVFLHSSL